MPLVNEDPALQRAEALAAHFYTDADAFAREQQQIMARAWHLVAHAAELRDTGDHVATTIAGVPLLVLRQPDGTLRALHNVCRHRGGPLVRGSGRALRSLRCLYHGWTYGLDGALKSVPAMGAACDFDMAQIALPQAEVMEWQGLVFASLGGAPAFAQFVEGIAAALQPTRLDAMAFHARRVYEVDCNWKVYVDNYLEGYHIPHVHPSLDGLIAYSDYEVAWGGLQVLQHSPLTGDGTVYGQGTVHYYWLWPTTMLNVTPGRLQSNRVEALGLRKTRVTFDFFYEESAASRFQVDLEVSDQVQAEDALICEDVQRALESGSYRPGRLSPRREGGLWHFQQLVRAAHQR
ncbi:aromatic ring-hydroxylating oxygenase subunit alpha [Pseudorhodoferax sp.]|uniref:aromatic ring-hydroxylating oxygenase subunit alpha n=1 Tax=Pseudorhodoferax sp. TaxID=1993553 RepID=UPI002DD68AEA|nr:aromatic ring-hydroxylating dioxygenase subunit alpha [Pseudorhodoferax sp.]